MYLVGLAINKIIYKPVPTFEPLTYIVALGGSVNKTIHNDGGSVWYEYYISLTI